MSNQAKLTLHIEQTHDCGQVITHVLHIDSADFSLSLPPFMDLSREEPGKFKPFVLAKRKIDFSGDYEKFEVNGLELKGRRFLCVKCGADIFFPEPD